MENQCFQIPGGKKILLPSNQHTGVINGGPKKKHPNIVMNQKLSGHEQKKHGCLLKIYQIEEKKNHLIHCL